MEFSLLSQVNKLYFPFRQKETKKTEEVKYYQPTNNYLQATVKFSETITDSKRPFYDIHIPLCFCQPTSFPLVVEDMKN